MEKPIHPKCYDGKRKLEWKWTNDIPYVLERDESIRFKQLKSLRVKIIT